MKRILTLLMIALLPVMMMAQPTSIRRMLRSCDTGKEVTRIHLPPLLMRMASWIVDDDEARHIIKNVNCLYLLASEDKEFSRQSDFPTTIVRKLKGKDFEEMLVVNDRGEKVTILLRETKRNRKELVIAVDGDEDVVLYLRGKLDLDEIMNGEHLSVAGVNLHNVSIQ